MPDILGRRQLKPFQDGIHLDFARGVHYVKPAGLPATIAPFASLFTLTGGNESRYMGANGVLIPSATNTPRIEYDINGNLLGLLIEGARTNIGLHSDDGTNAAWVKSNTTAAKTSTGPDGVANSATRVTATAGNGTILQTVTSGSATRAYSVWLKRITGTGNIQLTVDNGSTWTTKTITSSWARYDISQAAVTNPVFGIRIVTSGDAVDFYGNQLESAAFPSSYIPTTTASVARTADYALRTPIGTGIYNDLAGTVVCDFSVPTTGGTFKNPYWIGDNSTNQNALNTWAPNGSGNINAIVFSGGVTSVLTSYGAIAVNTRYKIATAAQLNDFATAMNGSAVTTDASGAMPVGVDRVIIGSASGPGDHLYGHIRRLDYWPERKANAELQRLTA